MAVSILFVCLHGAAKSVMAAAHCRRLAADRGLAVDVGAAGLEPDDVIPPSVVRGLALEGIDVSGQRPRRPAADDVTGADLVVTFGCDLGPLAAGARRVVRWDDVPAVSDDFERARDVIVGRVTALVDDLASRR